MLEQIQTEQDDLLRQIKELRAKLESDVKNQHKRMGDVEDKMTQIEITQADQMFLGKEIQRQRTSLNLVETALDQAESGSNLKALRDTLRELQKTEENKMSKIRKQVDGIEQFILKSLKNKLNEENKSSQTKISNVKRNYEEFLKRYEKVQTVFNGCVE